MSTVDDFFKFARERHAVYLRRAAGEVKPWTSDPILLDNKFTNVFRELDRTTAWFKQHVREPMRDRPEVLLATVIFRWFNRISTGEAIFCQPSLDGRTAFDRYVETGRTAELRSSIVALCGSGPYVTGSYTINTNMAPRGTPKLDGVLFLIDRWVQKHDWRYVAEAHLRRDPTPMALSGRPRGAMEDLCHWLYGDCLGGFMAYEVACDLRYTDLLEATDRLTWANPGPGALRGLNRIHGRRKEGSDSWGMLAPTEQLVSEMRDLLRLSRMKKHWPQNVDMREAKTARARSCGLDWSGYDLPAPLHRGPWPAWEMREVEHTLCEFDKYCRISEGAGRTRGSFNGRA